MEVLELLEVIADLTGTGKTELAEKLKANSVDNKLDATTVIKVLKESFGAKFKSISEQQYSRGKKEKGQSLESEIKTKFGISSDKKGIELVDELVSVKEAKAKEAKGEKNILTAENVGQNPIVLEFVKGKVQAGRKELETEITKLKGKLSEQGNKMLKNDVRTAVFKELKTAKAKLWDKDSIIPERAETIDLYLEKYNFKRTESGAIIPVDKDGNQLADPTTFNNLTIKDIAKKVNPFGFHVQDPNNSSPSPTTQPTTVIGGGKPNQRFKDRNAYMQFMNSGASQEDKTKAANEWKAQKAETKK